MALSSILCRAQEREQLDRAAGATLENVRVIAERAAKAWGIEAELSEKAEAKKAAYERVRLENATDAGNDDEETHAAWLSENPDRGQSA